VLAALAASLVVLLGIGGAWLLFAGGHKHRPDLIYHKVGRGRLQLAVVERGQLESAENREVVCRVKARNQSSTVATTIRWVIDEGTEVKKGDKLVDLDDSGLYEQLKAQKIDLDKAKNDWDAAEEQLKIVKSQNETDIAKAHLDLLLAEIELEKYKEGDYKAAKLDIEGRLEMASSDLEMWEERAAWSARMSKPGKRYVTEAQAQSDLARKVAAAIIRDKVKDELRVLKEYTYKKETATRQGAIDEAKRALARVQTQAKAKENTAKTDRDTKRSVYEQQLARYRDIEEEIKKCLILAPQDGLVVYFVPEQSRYGTGQQQSIVAQGESVREGQKLMRIPDLSKMQVNTRVHEAMVSRVRGEVWVKTGFSESVQAGMLVVPGLTSRLTNQSAYLNLRERFLDEHRDKELRMVSGGQKARVRVDSFPDAHMEGHVKTVATMASQQDWLSADVKVYQTMVAIDHSVPGLKPGMSAEVTIFTDSHRDNCLLVPLQAIVGSVDMGMVRKCYVKTSRGPEEREIIVGLSNDKEAEIVSGLQEGDEVVLNPRVLLSDREKAQLAEAANKAKGKGKGKDGPKGEGKGGKGGPGGPRGGKGGPGGAPPGDGRP
jgi:multidrug resistance efflux pump